MRLLNSVAFSFSASIFIMDMEGNRKLHGRRFGGIRLEMKPLDVDEYYSLAAFVGV